MSLATAAAPTLSVAGFTPTPNHILLSSDLSAEAKLTYLIIRHHDRGRGCFACRETMAQEIGLSPYHLRKGICELVDHGIIMLEKRRMGLTDLIRLVDHDWGLPNPFETDPTNPEFELPGEPPLPVQPVEAEEDIVEEPVEVALVSDEEPTEEPVEVGFAPDGEPAEDAVQPVELDVESPSSRSSNDLNCKYDAFNDLNKHIHTPSTNQGRIEETGQTTPGSEWQELIQFFYEKKEGRTPTRNELFNWKPTATRLLAEFTLPELISATEYAIEKGARLFYYVALVGPGYILEQRQQKQSVVERLKRASTALSQERQQTHRLEALRCSAREFDAETKVLLAGIEARMRPQSFRTWFQDAYIVDVTEDTLTVAVASQGAADWITKSYMALLEEVSGKAHIRVIAASGEGGIP